MTKRYIRTYRLTLGIPISFYEGEVSSTIIATPPDRLARRAFINESLNSRPRGESERNVSNATLGSPRPVIGADGVPNSLLDVPRRAYEQFFTEQKDLSDRLNLAKAQGVIIDGLNISFDLAIGADETNNKITIYNISDRTRDLLLQRESKFKPVVTLEAGYQNDSDLALVFKGEVVHVNDVWEGATRVTTLTVQAAPTAIKEAYTIKSYKKGTDVQTIVREIISDMKLDAGVLYIPEEDGTAVKVDKTRYIQCQSWEGLQSLCGQYELKATIANGEVNVTPQNVKGNSRQPDSVEKFIAASSGRSSLFDIAGAAITRGVLSVDATIASARRATIGFLGRAGDFSLENSFLLGGFANRSNPTSQVDFNDGLVAPFTARSTGIDFERIQARLFDTRSGNIIGSPVIDQGDETMERQDGKSQVIKIKVFLDATIKLEDIVKVKSNFIDGVYRVTGIRHYGEWEGNEWYSELALELLDSWVTDNGVDESNTAALKALRERYENVQ